MDSEHSRRGSRACASQPGAQWVCGSGRSCDLGKARDVFPHLASEPSVTPFDVSPWLRAPSQALRPPSGTEPHSERGRVGLNSQPRGNHSLEGAGSSVSVGRRSVPARDAEPSAATETCLGFRPQQQGVGFSRV